MRTQKLPVRARAIDSSVRVTLRARPPAGGTARRNCFREISRNFSSGVFFVVEILIMFRSNTLFFEPINTVLAKEMCSYKRKFLKKSPAAGCKFRRTITPPVPLFRKISNKEEILLEFGLMKSTNFA